MYSQFGSSTWISPFGLMFLAAIAVAWWLSRRNAISANVDSSHIDLLLPIAVIVGVTGGTLLSLMMPADRMIAGEEMQAGTRLRLFGMLAVSTVAVFAYSRLAGLSFRRLLDIFALPTIAGLMIHRVGCFLAGCCWGDLVSGTHLTRYATQVRTLPILDGLSGGVQYPPGSLPYEQHLALDLIHFGSPASLPVYPVQLYEAALLLVILLALYRLPWQQYPKGKLTVLVIGAYALARFFLEYLRADGSIVLGNMTVTQIQCLVLLFGVVSLRRASSNRHQGPDQDVRRRV